MYVKWICNAVDADNTPGGYFKDANLQELQLRTLQYYLCSFSQNDSLFSRIKPHSLLMTVKNLPKYCGNNHSCYGLNTTQTTQPFVSH